MHILKLEDAGEYLEEVPGSRGYLPAVPAAYVTCSCGWRDTQYAPSTGREVQVRRKKFTAHLTWMENHLIVEMKLQNSPIIIGLTDV